MTKKILSFAVAMIMLIACFSFTAAAADTFELVSAKVNPETWEVTLTFSEKVHIFKTGYVWLCTKPEPAGGYDQFGPSSVEYLDPVVNSGNEYSETVKLSFTKPANANDFRFADNDPADITQVGIRIVEYFLEDTNTNAVSPEVITTVDGKALKSNYLTGNVDICWIPTEGWYDAMTSRGWGSLTTRGNYEVTMELIKPEVTLINTIDAELGKLEFTFTQSVKLVTGYEMDTDGTKSVSVTSANGAEYDVTYIVDFGESVAGNTEYSIPADMFKTKNGTGLGSSREGLIADYPLPTFENISDKFTADEKYSFMNTDTGRMLTVDGKTEFTLKYYGTVNKYALTDDAGKFVNLQTMALQDARYIFDIVLNNDYERFQLVTQSGTVLYDNDTGTTNAATVAYAVYGSNVIETGWYMTKSGDELPKKFVCIGDSITCGVTPETATVKPGYRKELSALLLEKYGRVVFVGNLKHAKGYNTTAIDNTLITDGFMYRHEGHSGWVIETGHYPNASAPDNNRGIADLREGLQTKYAPDVVFMMIGINDVGMMGAYDGNDTKLTTIASRWETLVRAILEDLPEDGLLFGASLTPRTNSSGQWHTSQNEAISKLNAKYAAIVAKINAEGDNRLVTADNYTYVKNAGTAALSSDMIHLTSTGFTALARSYFDSYVKATTVKEGDFNKSGAVDADDAIYLLYNVFFGAEEYPLTGNGDVNSDGKENADDAIYLLYNVFFGDTEYPLYPEAEEDEEDQGGGNDNEWTGNY